MLSNGSMVVVSDWLRLRVGYLRLLHSSDPRTVFLSIPIRNKLAYPHTTLGYGFTLIYGIDEAPRMLSFSAQQADYRHLIPESLPLHTITTFILLYYGGS